MKCSELGDEQHSVLQEIQRGRAGKRFGRTISTVAERLQWSRTVVKNLCEELDDLGFVQLTHNQDIELVIRCECGPTGIISALEASRAGRRTDAQADTRADPRAPGQARTFSSTSTSIKRNLNPYGVSFSANEASSFAGTRAFYLGINSAAGNPKPSATGPGPKPVAWDSDQDSSPKRSAQVDPETRVWERSRKSLKSQSRRWYPVDSRWTGTDLATYFKWQLIGQYPGRDVQIPVTVLAKQLRDWMKTDEAVGPPLVKEMIDNFVADSRNVESGVPAWKSFLGARKSLLRKVAEAHRYDVSESEVDDALDTALAQVLDT